MASEQRAADVDREGRDGQHGQHDFDFIFGSWKVHNRKLRNPLTGSTDWYEFEATSVARPVWGGKANLDEFEAPDTPAGPIQGMTLRLYNPQSRLWSIHWSNSDRGVLDVPMLGWFTDGVGEFYDQELLRGRPIFSRFLWTTDGPDACRWEQAFSGDGGRTWEVNWVMELTRVG